MRRARSWYAVLPFALAAVPACSGDADTPSHRLAVRGGTHRDGSGRLGLAVLATLRDSSGAGPAAPAAAAVSDGTGPLADGVYPAGGVGSYAAWWWPELAVRDGERYALDLTGEALSSRREFSASTSDGLALPQPALSPARRLRRHRGSRSELLSSRSAQSLLLRGVAGVGLLVEGVDLPESEVERAPIAGISVFAPEAWDTIEGADGRW